MFGLIEAIAPGETRAFDDTAGFAAFVLAGIAVGFFTIPIGAAVGIVVGSVAGAAVTAWIRAARARWGVAVAARGIRPVVVLVVLAFTPVIPAVVTAAIAPEFAGNSLAAASIVGAPALVLALAGARRVRDAYLRAEWAAREPPAASLPWSTPPELPAR